MDLDFGDQEEEETLGQQNPSPDFQDGEGGRARLPGLRIFLGF